MNKFLYAEVSASDFMLLPVSSIVSIDGASATSILIYYNNLEADDTDAGAAEKLPIITITVTSGEAKAYLHDLAEAINSPAKSHTGFIDLEGLSTTGTVASIAVVPA